MTTAPGCPKWPVFDTKTVSDEVRSLRIRLRMLEIEIKENYNVLRERMDKLEAELDEFINR